MMKKLAIAALLTLWPLTASATVVPIQGRYCDDGNPNSAGVSVTTDGVFSEDDQPFAKVLKSGPNWWDVSYKDLPGVTARVSLNGNNLTITDSDDTYPMVLHRCN